MHLLSLKDFTLEEIEKTVELAEKLRLAKNSGRLIQPLVGKSLVMIFEKNSLRTRTTFELGMFELGGHAVMMDPNMIKLGERETIADAAKNFSRWTSAIMIRTFGQERIIELADNSSVPIINALTDEYHPCQALAFYQALVINDAVRKGMKIAFVGDGNNVCNSFALLCAHKGWEFIQIGPEGYEMKEEFINECKAINPDFKITVSNKKEDIKDSNVIYTDVWASMGQEDETESRKQQFMPYQVNSELVSMASDDVLVSHCLPAHRGEEITSEVLDSERAIAFDEAECRLHAQKAVLTYLVNESFNV